MKSTEENLGRSLGNHLNRYSGIGVFLVAVVLRGLVGWILADNLNADPDAYSAIAQSIERCGVYGLVDDQGIARPTAFRPPLYPWLLSALSFDGKIYHTGVLVLHAFLGGWTVLATFLISRRYVSVLLAFFAASLVLVDPILLMQSSLVMTETLATALSATVLWWCACRPKHADNCGAWDGARAIVLGVLLTLSYLCRPTFLVWAVLLAAAFAAASFWRDRWTNWRSNLMQAAIPLLMVAVGVGAWTARNLNAIGHPVWATTHGGYTLLLGNNPMFYEHLRSSHPGDVWDAGPFLEDYRNRYQVEGQEEQDRVGEYEDDRMVYEVAMSTIANHPGMFVYSCFVRLARLWSPMPHQIEGRSAAMGVCVGVFYSATFLVAFLGFIKLRQRLFDHFLLAGMTLALTLSVVHSVYWSNMRMRAPLTPVIAVLAAVGCCRRELEPRMGNTVAGPARVQSKDV